MRIGIFLSNTNPARGGGYQYEITLSRLIHKNGKKDFEFFFIVNNKMLLNKLASEGLKSIYLKTNFINKIIYLLFKNSYLRKFFYKNFNFLTLEKKLFKYDLDLIYFISPNDDVKYIENHNIVTTIWDQCHRDNVEFPEVSHNYQFKKRETFISENIKRSVKIIVESEKSKKNLSQRYGIDLNRICVLQLMPSSFIEKYQNISSNEINEVLNKFSLKKNFLFYPAQLWPHKNHVYIIEALNILVNEKKIDICFYFCGEDKGNLKYINKIIKFYKLENYVKYLGFLSDKEMVALYKSTLALVMPTYFGNANIPPLDAFKLSCPVIYTKFDEQETLFNSSIWEIQLDNSNKLSNLILDLMKNEELKNQKIKNGLKYLDSIKEEKIWLKLNNIFNKYRLLKKCWK